MAEKRLEALLRRDRLVVASALALVAALGWTYVVWLTAQMEMDGGAPAAAMERMQGMEMQVVLPAFQPWTAAQFALTFLMWSAMMIGMMIPSAAPMALIYARVGRQAVERGSPFASTGWFVGGYAIAWMGFSLLATSAQWALERMALLTPMVETATNAFGGLLLIAAGLYQWTPIKDACLSQCQAPFAFIQRHGGFPRDGAGALRMGLTHGLYCIGCCWALMALLFVAGVMNVVWIAALAAYVLIEKIVPLGRVLPRLTGAALVIGGGWLLVM